MTAITKVRAALDAAKIPHEVAIAVDPEMEDDEVRFPHLPGLYLQAGALSHYVILHRETDDGADALFHAESCRGVDMARLVAVLQSAARP